MNESLRREGYRHPKDWHRGMDDGASGRRRRWFQGRAYNRGWRHGRQCRRAMSSL